MRVLLDDGQNIALADDDVLLVIELDVYKRQGMTRLVREKCDFLVSIPMKGKISSLNASAAAAILLYEAVRQRLGQ